MRREVYIALLVLFSAVSSSLPAAGLTPKVETGVDVAQVGTEIRSTGFARVVDLDTGTLVNTLELTGTHAIRDEGSFSDVWLTDVWGTSWFTTLRFLTPEIGSCYRGRIFARISLTFENDDSVSPTEACYTPELPPGSETDDPFNQEHCDCDPDPEVLCGCSPILVDLEGDGFRLVGVEDSVSFDINATGTPLDISWTHPATDDAFLVLDRNGNGTIDDGTELFGTATPQPASGDPNGFRALAVYDLPEHGGNGDGVITADDAVWVDLHLWRDASHDGLSQPWELTPLAASAVRSVDLDYVQTLRRDAHGNWFRWMSRVQAQRRPHQAVDVIFRGR